MLEEGGLCWNQGYRRGYNLIMHFRLFWGEGKLQFVFFSSCGEVLCHVSHKIATVCPYILYYKFSFSRFLGIQ